MVQAAFLETADNKDLMALFQRAIIVLNTKSWVCGRRAGQEECAVLRFCLKAEDFLEG